MGDLDDKLNIRISRALRALIDEDAKQAAQTRSEWVIEACLDKLARYSGRSRVLQVQRKDRALTPTNLCTHPLSSRSEKVAGESRCMACGSIMKQL